MLDINFFKGHPTISLLPTTELAEAYQKVLVETPSSEPDYENDPENRHPLQYGLDPGNATIRQTLARWTAGKYGRSPANCDTFNLTNGLSFGAGAVLSGCTSANVTKHAFLVSPTYFLINYSFADFGFAGNMSAVAETPGGDYDLDLVLLQNQLAQLNAQHGFEKVGDSEINVFDDPTERGPRKFYRYVMYLVPTFSNPGGLTYSLKTRQKLLEIARQNDMLLLSDDVYDFLGYTREMPPLKLNYLDADTLPHGWKFGNTVSNSSFSKIVAPGLRVGWHETATPHLAQQLATLGPVKSGGTPSQLNTFVIQELINSGRLDAIIDKLATAYLARAQTMLRALGTYLPRKYTSFYGGAGGYFVWVSIEAPGLNVADTIRKVKQNHGVIIADGSNFEVSDNSLGWGRTHARLCVALLTNEQIDKGIQLWGEVIRQEHPELYEK